MDNPLINNYTNSPISREAGVRTNLSQTNTQLFNVGANFMPTERQTSIRVYNPAKVTKTPTKTTTTKTITTPPTTTNTTTTHTTTTTTKTTTTK